MTAARVVLLLDVIAFAIFAAWGLFAPESLAESITLGVDTPGALTEVRATYGGLELGITAALATGLLRPALTRPMLVVAGCAFGGFALGRYLGMAIDGVVQLHVILSTVEVACAALNAAVWFRSEPVTP